MIDYGGRLTRKEKVRMLSVLQVADSPFLAEIAARDDVCVVTVTEENRNTLPRQLLEQGW